MNAQRGPVCGEDVGPAWIDGGTLARAHPDPGAGGRRRTERGRTGAAAGSDAAGARSRRHPRPDADLGRHEWGPLRLPGDWFGFGLSSIAIVPLVGDLAKAGKLGRWAETVDKPIRAARTSPAFELRARPLLQRLALLVLGLPDRLLPAAARPSLARLKQSVARFAPASWKDGSSSMSTTTCRNKPCARAICLS